MIGKQAQPDGRLRRVLRPRDGRGGEPFESGAITWNPLLRRDRHSRRVGRIRLQRTINACGSSVGLSRQGLCAPIHERSLKMKFPSLLILVLVAGGAHAGQRLGVASYGQTGGTQYGGASYGSGQIQSYSAGGVNADIGRRYSGTAGGSQFGDTSSDRSGMTNSQPRSPSLYPSTGSSTLQQPKAPK